MSLWCEPEIQRERHTQCPTYLLQQVISNKVQRVPFPHLLSKSSRDLANTGLPETTRKGSFLLLKGETCFSCTIAMGACVHTKQNRNGIEKVGLFEESTVMGVTVKGQEDSDLAFLGWHVALAWQAATIVPLSQRRRQRSDLVPEKQRDHHCTGLSWDTGSSQQQTELALPSLAGRVGLRRSVWVRGRSD